MNNRKGLSSIVKITSPNARDMPPYLFARIISRRYHPDQETTRKSVPSLGPLSFLRCPPPAGRSFFAAAHRSGESDRERDPVERVERFRSAGGYLRGPCPPKAKFTARQGYASRLYFFVLQITRVHLTCTRGDEMKPNVVPAVSLFPHAFDFFEFCLLPPLLRSLLSFRFWYSFVSFPSFNLKFSFPPAFRSLVSP